MVAAAEARGRKWQKNHAKKAELAENLATDGVLSTDVSGRLRELNELRKDVAYGEPGPELSAFDAESLAAELEEFIDEVEQAIEGAGSE